MFCGDFQPITKQYSEGKDNFTSCVADPGFPLVRGANPISGSGGVKLRPGVFLAKMYVKTKELGSTGGATTAPLRSANVQFILLIRSVNLHKIN